LEIPFLIERGINIFHRIGLNYKGDPAKKRRQVFFFTRNLHVVLLFSIPLLIGLLIYFQWKGNPPEANNMGLFIFCSYIINLFLILLVYKWNNIYKKFYQYIFVGNIFTFNDATWELFVFHLTRIGNIAAMVFWEYVMIFGGAGWLALTPLFILAEITLLLTYPTEKRWTIWIKKFSGINE
jgi:hypothetical protein